MHGTEEASNDGKVKVRIIHGLNISQKNSYTYCKNLEVIKTQVLRACSQGDRLVGKDHRSPPTATHKDAKPGTLHVSILLHNFNHTCMLQDLQTSTQAFLKFTTTQQHDSNITTFISQNNYQVSNFSQYSMNLYESFYYTQLGCPSYQD